MKNQFKKYMNVSKEHRKRELFTSFSKEGMLKYNEITMESPANIFQDPKDYVIKAQKKKKKLKFILDKDGKPVAIKRQTKSNNAPHNTSHNNTKNHVFQ